MGRPATARCEVTGAKPRAAVNFTLQSNGSEVRQVDFTNVTVEEGEGGLVAYSASFLPLLEDLGTTLGCIVTQHDGEGSILLQVEKKTAHNFQSPGNPSCCHVPVPGLRPPTSAAEPGPGHAGEPGCDRGRGQVKRGRDASILRTPGVLQAPPQPPGPWCVQPVVPLQVLHLLLLAPIAQTTLAAVLVSWLATWMQGSMRPRWSR